jgi:hypothetical protein
MHFHNMAIFITENHNFLQNGYTFRPALSYDQSYKIVSLCWSTCLALHVFVGPKMIKSEAKHVVIYRNTNIVG